MQIELVKYKLVLEQSVLTEYLGVAILLFCSKMVRFHR